MAAGNYADLALAAPAERLGRCGDDKLQRRFTQEIAEYRAAVLAQQFCARPDTDFPSQAALNCDRISWVFLTALPSEENSCLDRIWRAGFAHHFVLAYSAFARHKGQALQGGNPKTPNSIIGEGEGMRRPDQAPRRHCLASHGHMLAGGVPVSTRPILCSTTVFPIGLSGVADDIEPPHRQLHHSGHLHQSRHRTAAPATTLLRTSTSVQVRARRRSWWT